MSPRRAAGFTLLEILVAFGLLALGLTLLLGTLSGASKQVRQAGDAGRAALYAQSLLDEHLLMLQKPLRESGQFENGRYRWQLEVKPWADPRQPQIQDPFAARLLHVQLQVHWGDGGIGEQLQISSLRLALPPAESVAL
ncbi:MAG: prepilin-type N-terminal cleavage/methylation domain-containing protein [Thermomonas sp.]|jgi:general secretion pathway protein I|uniref:type II secretion system protein XpsI n=1 Tax=Thermomonas sp. TaxID=1971895 RepID=UPI001ED0418D|nr:prepilin-type N-terminal cleavage/methylation domain-containing protein [Thermomonas sp.]MBV2209739.1 prepilin-type N-terminal cleavage/methylation domain-containing protein [Thermomonas sp.]